MSVCVQWVRMEKSEWCASAWIRVGLSGSEWLRMGWIVWDMLECVRLVSMGNKS